VARERPDLVDGLVLLGIGPRLPVPDDALERAAEDFPAEAARLVRTSFAEGEPRARERALALVAAAGPATLAADYAACRAFDAEPWLGEVSQPALVLAGAGDAITPVAAGEAEARSLPAALMAVVPDAGHLAMVEGAQAVNLLIAGYLGRLELTLDDGD
jgi:pimeloyl-ACP methyl ester carboxylesterase